VEATFVRASTRVGFNGAVTGGRLPASHTHDDRREPGGVTDQTRGVDLPRLRPLVTCDVATGERRWARAVSSDAPLAAAGDTLYVGDDVGTDAELLALAG
jgi:hypothetical protein